MQRVDLMTSNDRNEETVLSFYTQLMKRDIDTFSALWTEDGVQEHVFGFHGLTPALVGRAEVEADYRRMFKNRSGHVFTVSALHRTSDSDVLIVEARGRIGWEQSFGGAPTATQRCEPGGRSTTAVGRRHRPAADLIRQMGDCRARTDRQSRGGADAACGALGGPGASAGRCVRLTGRQRHSRPLRGRACATAAKAGSSSGAGS